MKRYFLSLSAIALAVGFSAFTNSAKFADYFATGEVTSGGIQYYTVQAWSNQPCPGAQNVACRITSNVAPDAQNRIPKSAATIVTKKQAF